MENLISYISSEAFRDLLVILFRDGLIVFVAWFAAQRLVEGLNARLRRWGLEPTSIPLEPEEAEPRLDLHKAGEAAPLEAPSSEPEGAPAEEAPPEVAAEKREHFALGLLRLWCGASIWALGGWLLAALHESPAWVGVFRWALIQGWRVVGVIGVALLIGRGVSAGLEALLRAPSTREAWGWREGSRGEAHLELFVFVADYTARGFLALLVLIAFADMAEFHELGRVIGLLWGLALRLLTAVMILLLGWVSLIWLSKARGEGEEDRVHQVRLSVVGVVLLLSIAVIASQNTLFIFIVVALLFGNTLYEHLPHFWAGRLLRSRAIEEVVWQGEVVQVMEVGHLQTRLLVGAQELRVSNQEALGAALRPEPPVSEA